MNLHWPQITWMILAFIALLNAAIKDGEPKNETHRFGIKLMDVAIAAFILWCGGFFG